MDAWLHAAEVCNAGFPGENSSQVIEEMRAFPPILLFLQVVSPVASIATVTTTLKSLARTPRVMVDMESGDALMFDSLREDVSRHPDDFVSFQTRTAALRFINEHGFEVNRETARRMIERLGYWRGKMVVVVPIAQGLK
ncbi:hypothetical protein [Edaphobacter modestus]|uniref:Uncharacterized protein n=1 Tax=Edaphobacter modestus TaxID=388466 RepID=A0A4Q7XZX3_9BACT|nr:hypothetical protein [Edaphobacter modestus]RZU29005.1 hypothetical protein BDD14_6593 [Edaphobacter modestus]